MAGERDPDAAGRAAVYPVLGIDNSNTGQLQDRPNLVGDPYAAGGTCTETRTADCWVNPAAFAQPAPLTFGNAGRNSLRGPGYKNVDLSFVKNAGSMGGGRQLQFRIEVFNLFNTVNYDNPNRTALTPNFGKIFTAGPPRRCSQGCASMYEREGDRPELLLARARHLLRIHRVRQRQPVVVCHVADLQVVPVRRCV